MKISVAMATFNGEKFILEQLSTIHNQTYQADEIVIVDDSSTDDTVTIVEDFINRNNLNHWKLIKRQENQGYILNFIEALSYTTGDIVFLCDQDDIWFENKIKTMCLQMMENSNIGILASSFVVIDKEGKQKLTKLAPFASNNNLIKKRIRGNTCKIVSWKDQITYNASPGCCIAIRRHIVDIYLNNNYTHSIPHDYALSVIASLHQGLYYLNVPLIGYRIHDNNAVGFKAAYTSTKSTVGLRASLEMIKSLKLSNVIMKSAIHYNLHLINFFDLLYRSVYAPEPSRIERFKLLLAAIRVRGIVRTVLIKIFEKVR